MGSFFLSVALLLSKWLMWDEVIAFFRLMMSFFHKVLQPSENADFQWTRFFWNSVNFLFFLSNFSLQTRDLDIT